MDWSLGWRQPRLARGVPSTGEQEKPGTGKWTQESTFLLGSPSKEKKMHLKMSTHLSLGTEYY